MWWQTLEEMHVKRYGDTSNYERYVEYCLDALPLTNKVIWYLIIGSFCNIIRGSLAGNVTPI